jgi:hypothetical protein
MRLVGLTYIEEHDAIEDSSYEEGGECDGHQGCDEDGNGGSDCDARR